MIDRCVCSERTFAEMKIVIDRNKLHNIDQLREHIDFGQNCALCIPYVRQVFATGKTEFDIIITGDNS